MANIATPVLLMPIPDLEGYEGSDLPAINFLDYIQNPSSECGDIHFTVTLSNGQPLPDGIEYTDDGILYGIAEEGTARPDPYKLLIIAKNDADVPLVTYMDLTLHEALPEREVEAPAKEESAGFDEAALIEDFWGELEEETSELPAEEKLWEDFAPVANTLDDPEYREFFVKYLLRKFSSLQFYNADYEGTVKFQALKVKEATTGWPIYEDGDFAMATSNPEPYAAYLNRGLFIDTLKEMLDLAAEKGWKTIGVAGFEKGVGWQVVRRYNAEQKQKPREQQHIFEYEDIFQDKAFVDKALEYPFVQT